MTNEVFMKYYNPSEYFKYSNPNPSADDRKTLKWNKADCCVRALALSTGSEWLTAYDFLSAMARRDFSMPNDRYGFRSWLIEHGAVWYGLKAVKNTKRTTLKDFALSHKTGRYILALSRHECACVDGVLRDTWNCGGKALDGYYDMTNFHF